MKQLIPLFLILALITFETSYSFGIRDILGRSRKTKNKRSSYNSDPKTSFKARERRQQEEQAARPRFEYIDLHSEDERESNSTSLTSNAESYSLNDEPVEVLFDINDLKHRYSNGSDWYLDYGMKQSSESAPEVYSDDDSEDEGFGSSQDEMEFDYSNESESDMQTDVEKYLGPDSDDELTDSEYEFNDDFLHQSEIREKSAIKRASIPDSDDDSDYESGSDIEPEGFVKSGSDFGYEGHIQTTNKPVQAVK